MTTSTVEIPKRRKRWQKTLSKRMVQLYRDPFVLVSVLVLLLVLVVCLFANYLAPADPLQQSLPMRLMPPAWFGGSPDHFLGTDALGRDLLSRLMYGGRYTLLIAFTATLIALILGVLLGAIAGYYGGMIDNIIMRLVDVQMSFTGMLLTLIIVVMLGASIPTLILVLGIISWVIYARVVRGAVLELRQTEFVNASLAMGSTDLWILLRHIIPHLKATIISLIILETARLMVVESSLSFLGFGVQPPDTTWGLLIAEGRQYIYQAWWLITFPGLAIFLTVLCGNQIGIWLRAYSDPFEH